MELFESLSSEEKQDFEEALQPTESNDTSSSALEGESSSNPVDTPTTEDTPATEKEAHTSRRRVAASIRRGERCQLNWGASLGWTKKETFRRFAPYDPRDPEFHAAQTPNKVYQITEADEDTSFLDRFSLKAALD
ncbi:hypothetical protein V5O48_019500 [Marasmius crinis-equi]|uniref:Uncharacterized protein n=1 Tax=Marasmius crinis-equi TaxID=585013 RepID=A0ABR3EIA3_9AGAR